MISIMQLCNHILQRHPIRMGGVFFFGLLQVKLWFNSIDSTLKGSMNHTFVLSILKALVDSSMIQTYTNLYVIFQYTLANCTVCLWMFSVSFGFFFGAKPKATHKSQTSVQSCCKERQGRDQMKACIFSVVCKEQL